MTLRRLWNVAPIWTTNLLETGLINAAFNTNLTLAVLKAFDLYVATRRGGVSNVELSASGGDKRRRRRKTVQVGVAVDTPKLTSSTTADKQVSDNDYFFEHQRTRGYHLATELISSSPEALQLQQTLLPDAASTYLREGCGLQGQRVAKLIDTGFLNLDLWAAVQRGQGAHHPDHVHEGALVSGVYYANVPEGSAPLLLQRPPDCVTTTWGQPDKDEEINSTGDIIFRPKEGQVVLFPPWLYHGVPLVDSSSSGNAASDEARVSLAFNVTGAYAWGDPWDVTRVSEQ
jgi:uncharacterized protein (TIGR02466 family)